MALLKISIAAAGAVLALAGGAALAAPALMSNDAHGDQVSAAAHKCQRHTSSDRDVHGDCVNRVATANAKSGPRSTTDRDTNDDLNSAGEDSADRDSEGAESADGARSVSHSTDKDQHGDAVSAAAHTCPSGTRADRDAHGDCVSKVARSHT